MMKTVVSIMLMAFSTVLCGQDNWDNLVKWEASYNKEQSTIDIQAKIQENWVIYSQFTPKGGPIPLKIEFDEIEGVEFLGDVKELTEPIKIESKMFEMIVIKFKEEASFSQEIKTELKHLIIKGNITFMSCDNEKCLPPKTVPFEVKI